MNNIGKKDTSLSPINFNSHLKRGLFCKSLNFFLATRRMTTKIIKES